MLLRYFPAALVVLLAGSSAPPVATSVGAAEQQPPAPDQTKPEDSAGIFGLTRIWTVHLTIPAGSWKGMTPAGGGSPCFGPRPGGGSGPPAQARPADGAARGGDRRPGMFGYDFQYARADIELDGEMFKDV